MKKRRNIEPALYTLRRLKQGREIARQIAQDQSLDSMRLVSHQIMS